MMGNDENYDDENDGCWWKWWVMMTLVVLPSSFSVASFSIFARLTLKNEEDEHDGVLLQQEDGEHDEVILQEELGEHDGV